ncbi:MAG: alpha-L-arabinofuranosidase [Candidatus Solibacter usitatus]|nr:alpha-L-arabinofuranosidase [Candidatus Solibacter usitatus]
MQRRNFLAASAGALVAPRVSQAANGAVTVLLNEPIGTISPLVHGHFVEHLGGVVYDGIWVGEGSKIPNVAGIRKPLIDALKKIQAPLFRWPGGCFADSYDWRDGIGPREKRPKRVNFWERSGMLAKMEGGKAKFDPNEFGTNEFMRFCQEVGGKPYVAANLRSGTARDFNDWVDYCNAPSGATTLGTQRGTAPFNVEYWGIGNESWGCGGDFTPEEYSVEFRRFTSWVPRFNVPLKFIPSGPNGADLNWSRGFFQALMRKSPGMLNRVWGWALHYYCGTTGGPVEFTSDEYYELLTRAVRMEELITSHWTVMGEYDREHRVKFAIDEWGAWHKAGSEVAPHHLFGQIGTMRDALIAALTLDIFHRHADKVAMANVAQLINCIHSLFIAHEDKFLATPNYHVFDMYKDHHNGQAVRSVFAAPRRGKLAGFDGSVSVQGKKLVLTCAHTDLGGPLPVEVTLTGGTARNASGHVLAADSPKAHNTFDRPESVKPRALKVEAAGDKLRLEMPPASVARIVVELG